MTARNLLLTLHIISITAWLGADFFQYVIGPRLVRSSREVETAWARQQVFTHDRYYAAAGGLILVTGLALVMHEGWSWSSGFIWVGISAVVIGAVVGGQFLKSIATKRLAALDAGDYDAADAAAKRMVPIEVFLSLVAAVTILAMVSKWKA